MSTTTTQLWLIGLAAMLSPTTLLFSVFALVLSERPLRTGFWFYLGALSATLAVGVVAAFVIGDVAATSDKNPKTWVAIVDIVAAAALLFFVVRALRRPRDPKRTAGMIDQMTKVASSPVIAVIGAGAALANPGGFIPLALKAISEKDPSTSRYIVYWVLFALASLLPLSVALILLSVNRDWTVGVLNGARGWLERNARIVAAVILLALAAALLRDGIAGLT